MMREARWLHQQSSCRAYRLISTHVKARHNRMSLEFQPGEQRWEDSWNLPVSRSKWSREFQVQ